MENRLRSQTGRPTFNVTNRFDFISKRYRAAMMEAVRAACEDSMMYASPPPSLAWGVRAIRRFESAQAITFNPLNDVHVAWVRGTARIIRFHAAMSAALSRISQHDH